MVPFNLYLSNNDEDIVVVFYLQTLGILDISLIVSVAIYRAIAI